MYVYEFAYFSIRCRIKSSISFGSASSEFSLCECTCECICLCACLFRCVCDIVVGIAQKAEIGIHQ